MWYRGKEEESQEDVTMEERHRKIQPLWALEMEWGHKSKNAGSP